MAELDEAVDEVGAYEAAAAGDDVLHGLRAGAQRAERAL